MSGSRFLVKELRRLREAAALSQEAWGERVHFSASHVGSVERGERPVLPDYLRAVDKAFGTALVEFYVEFVVGEQTPVWLRPFIEHEGRATLLRVYQPLLIPGLLQTEAYAQAVITRYGRQGKAAATALAGRLARQEILYREDPEPCRLVAVIDENVLRCRAGVAAVMRDQMKALVSANERPNITVQVIPSDVGVHPGMDGPFALATVDGRSVGYAEGQLLGRVVESPDATAELEQVWESIREYALPSHQSQELIMRTAETWT